MKGDCGRCLDMRLAESPVHDVKWHWLMAAMKVDLMRLKADAWNYLATNEWRVISARHVRTNG